MKKLFFVFVTANMALLPSLSYAKKSLTENLQSLCQKESDNANLQELRTNLDLAVNRAAKLAILATNSSGPASEYKKLANSLNSATEKSVASAKDCGSALKAMTCTLNSVAEADAILHKKASIPFLLSDEELNGRLSKKVGSFSKNFDTCGDDMYAISEKAAEKFHNSITDNLRQVDSQISAQYLLSLAGSSYDGEEPRFSKELGVAGCHEMTVLINLAQSRAKELNTDIKNFFKNLERQGAKCAE